MGRRKRYRCTVCVYCGEAIRVRAGAARVCAVCVDEIGRELKRAIEGCNDA